MISRETMIVLVTFVGLGALHLFLAEDHLKVYIIHV